MKGRGSPGRKDGAAGWEALEELGGVASGLGGAQRQASAGQVGLVVDPRVEPPCLLFLS